MAERNFFSFHTIRVQKGFNFKIEPRYNVTMHVQSHEVHHGCINVVLDNCKSFSKVWRSMYWYFKVVGQIHVVEWSLILTE